MHVLSQIHAAAVSSPDKTALVLDGEAVSYGRFWRMIEARRRDLQLALPGRGLVLVAVRNLLQGWVLDLALRSLGLDTALIRAPDEVALFAEYDIAALVTIRSEGRLDWAAPAEALRLDLADASGAGLAEEGPLPPTPDFGPPGVHYLLTSGTTGAPKPVLSELGGDDTVYRVTSQVRDPYFALGPNVVLCLFDIGLWTAEGYSRPIVLWSDGGAVVFDQRSKTHDQGLLWPGITHILATPYYLLQVLNTPEGSFPYRPGAVLMVSGGGLTPSVAREARRRLAPRTVVIVGSTEVGMWARQVVASDEDLGWHEVMAHCLVEVIDEAGRPLPPGRVGVVRVARRDPQGASLLGGPAVNARVLTDGWFYPGDLGLFDEQGRLALRGRAVDVININGLKISGEPWERQLEADLGADAVCILSGRFHGEEEELHVFVETRTPITADDLAGALRKTLHSFVEARAHKIDALPRTPLGKVRRVALAQRLLDGEFR